MSRNSYYTVFDMSTAHTLGLGTCMVPIYSHIFFFPASLHVTVCHCVQDTVAHPDNDAKQFVTVEWTAPLELPNEFRF